MGSATRAPYLLVSVTGRSSRLKQTQIPRAQKNSYAGHAGFDVSCPRHWPDPSEDPGRPAPRLRGEAQRNRHLESGRLAGSVAGTVEVEGGASSSTLN